METANSAMPLTKVDLGVTYIVKELDTGDAEMEKFLFTLGCYKVEEIVVVSHISSGYVVSIKDARYNIDKNLAEAILV